MPVEESSLHRLNRIIQEEKAKKLGLGYSDYMLVKDQKKLTKLRSVVKFLDDTGSDYKEYIKFIINVHGNSKFEVFPRIGYFALPKSFELWKNNQERYTFHPVSVEWDGEQIWDQKNNKYYGFPIHQVTNEDPVYSFRLYQVKRKALTPLKEKKRFDIDKDLLYDIELVLASLIFNRKEPECASLIPQVFKLWKVVSKAPLKKKQAERILDKAVITEKIMRAKHYFDKGWFVVGMLQVDQLNMMTGKNYTAKEIENWDLEKVIE